MRTWHSLGALERLIQSTAGNTERLCSVNNIERWARPILNGALCVAHLLRLLCFLAAFTLSRFLLGGFLGFVALGAVDMSECVASISEVKAASFFISVIGLAPVSQMICRFVGSSAGSISQDQTSCPKTAKARRAMPLVSQPIRIRRGRVMRCASTLSGRGSRV